MTETVDYPRAFRDALPRHVRDQLHTTQTVAGTIHAAVRDHGWTVPQLVYECCRDLAGVANIGGLLTYRLEQCAQHGPPQPVTRTGLPVIPLCGQCVDGFVLDPQTLLPARKCPCRTPAKETT